jgi:hypothetical protein
VGFHPDSTYQACVEIGAVRQVPVVLTPSFLYTLSVHLPAVCEYFCKKERHSCNELFFRLNILTGGFEPAAKFIMDYTSISLKAGRTEVPAVERVDLFPPACEIYDGRKGI